MPTCLNCNRTENDAPLIVLTLRGETLYICPQCLPALIHKPHTLVGKLPGVENLSAAEPD
jgi:hypothetical protein